MTSLPDGHELVNRGAIEEGWRFADVDVRSRYRLAVAWLKAESVLELLVESS